MTNKQQYQESVSGAFTISGGLATAIKTPVMGPPQSP